VAEHWLYLPTAFLFLAATIEVVALVETRPGESRSTISITASVLFAVWVIFLGARTFIRTFDWRDQRAFLEQTIGHGGDSARMLINLGGLDLSEGKLEDATLHFHVALQKKPDQPFAIINLAAIALSQSDFKLARELLERAREMPAVEAQAYELLALLENKEHGRIDLLRWRLAARTGPPNWSIEKRYVNLLDQTGAHSAAISEVQNCLKREWYRAESWQLLGELLSKEGLQDKAAIAFSYARSYDVHLNPHREDKFPPSPIVPSS
jgi:tetratricopeptide (TPR) repeat protein